VILDSRLRFPPYANLLRRNGPLPWIATTHSADQERQSTLEDAGAQIFRLPFSDQSLIDLNALLQHLGTWEINSLMVEGGAQVITNFLTSRLVDQVVITIAPVVVGGLRVLDNHGFFHPNHFPRLRHLHYQKVGEDLVICGEPCWPAS
jgi:3,4-dihydroxy 2-butanone 4-phosphate synthase/GTP cyclohydrolase II